MTRNAPGGESRIHAREVCPRLIQNPGTLERIEASLRAWSPSKVSAPLPSLDQVNNPGNPRKTFRNESALGLDGDALEEEEEVDVGSGQSGSSEELNGLKAEQVTWSRWDELEEDGSTGTILRRMLLIGYDSGGFTMWDASKLECWREYFSITVAHLTVDPEWSRAVVPVSRTRVLIGATVLPKPASSSGTATELWLRHGPLLVMLTREPGLSTSQVLFLSLRRQSVVHAFDVEGAAHRVVANMKFLVISTTSPRALHVFDTGSLSPLPLSPFLDVAPNPFDGSPVFDLGQGGRLLVYSTTKKIPISKLDDKASRVGTGIVAAAGMFGGELLSEESRAMVSQGGELALRAAEGVLNGVKAIGEIGLNYFSSAAEEKESPVFSKSAPLPLTTPLGFTTARKTASEAEFKLNASGALVIVDLVASAGLLSTIQGKRSARSSSTKVVAHFRPSQEPISLVSLSPSSSFVLTTSRSGHYSDVFELRPRVPAGSTSTGSLQRSEAVLHRYRLNRGLTAARVQSVTWSVDSRFVTIATSAGTTREEFLQQHGIFSHAFLIPDFSPADVYATSLLGGKPPLDLHFRPKVVNPTSVQPISVVLSPISRIRPSTDVPTSIASSPTHSIFVRKIDTLRSSLDPSTSNTHTPLSQIAFQDLIIFHPCSQKCLLHRITPATTAVGALVAVSRGDVVSGLSQLMRSHGVSTQTAGSPEVVANTSGRAEWALFNVEGSGSAVEVSEVRPTTQITIRQRFAAQAEIETFSRSPFVLPRSLYQSHQFNFFHALFSAGKLAPHLRRIEMRTDPVPTAGPNFSRPASPSSFNKPIRTAMQSHLDDGNFCPSNPAFPNGIAGKQGSWRDVLPLAVSPTLNSVVRRVAQRRSVSGSNSLGETTRSSLSFEDAIFPEPNGGQSKNGSPGVSSGGEGEDDGGEWALDCLDEEDVAQIPFDDFDHPTTHLKTNSNPSSSSVNSGISRESSPAPEKESQFSRNNAKE